MNKDSRWYKRIRYYFMGFVVLIMAYIFIFVVYKGGNSIYSIYKSFDVHQTLRHLKPGLDPCIRSRIAQSIQRASDKTGLPADLIVAVVWQESRFNPVARSKANAVGLMQIIEKYHKDTMEDLGITSNSIYHVDNNILLGTTILKNYILQTGSIQGGLEKYLGKHGPKYYASILETYTNLGLISVLQQTEVKTVK